MSAPTSRGLGGLLRKGWKEIPDVMGSGFMAVIGFGIGMYALHYYYNVVDGDNRRYKDIYTVIRHDDPRAARVRKD